MQTRGNNRNDRPGFGGWIQCRFRPLALSSSLFRENPLAGWKVTISANRRIGIPLLLHAREGVSYLRPSLNSPSVKSDQRSPARLPPPPPFSLFLSLPLLASFKLVPPFSLPFPVFCSFNFHWKPRTIAITRTGEDPRRSSKIAFRGSASVQGKWSLRRSATRK